VAYFSGRRRVGLLYRKAYTQSKQRICDLVSYAYCK
jgi:hypothetical protein